MSEYKASCDELIAAGWGDYDRADIPADWRTRSGPRQPHGDQRPKMVARGPAPTVWTKTLRRMKRGIGV